MPASFLKHHRTICAALTELKEYGEKYNDRFIVQICNEAIGYAQSMSKKLSEYKAEKEKQNDT